MDQDLSDLKIQFDVQRRLLQAVSHTQSEHSAVLRGHTALLQQHTAVLVDHTARLTRLETGVARLETGLSTVQAGVQTIIGLLDRDIDGGESSQR
jgi:hypothetical protein